MITTTNNTKIESQYQPAVPSEARQSLARADSDAFNGLGIDSTPSSTGWKQTDGSPIPDDDSKRAYALHTDTHHPASSHYQFSTPASIERQTHRRWKEGVAFTYRAFTTPSHVSLAAVESRVKAIECGPSLSPYGGLRIVTAVAVADEWGVSNEDLWQDETFREEFRQEVGDQAQVTSAKALRKLFELREKRE